MKQYGKRITGFLSGLQTEHSQVPRLFPPPYPGLGLEGPPFLAVGAFVCTNPFVS